MPVGTNVDLGRKKASKSQPVQQRTYLLRSSSKPPAEDESLESGDEAGQQEITNNILLEPVTRTCVSPKMFKHASVHQSEESEVTSDDTLSISADKFTESDEEQVPVEQTEPTNPNFIMVELDDWPFTETDDASVGDTSKLEEGSMLVESQDELPMEPKSVQAGDVQPLEDGQSAGEAGLRSGKIWSTPYKLADSTTSALFV